MSFYLGRNVGKPAPENGAPDLASATATHSAPSGIAGQNLRWRDLSKSISEQTDFKQICQLAIERESISREPGSALSFLVGQLPFEQAENLLINIDYSTDKTTRENALFLLHHRLAELNPGHAIQVALALPSSTRKVDLLTVGFEKLAANDTATALVLAKELEDPGYRYIAKEQILVALSQGSPEEALEFAQREHIRFPKGVCEAMMKQWVEDDLIAACKAVLHPKIDRESPTRSRLFYAICKKLLPADPERVLSILQQLQEIDPARSGSRSREVIGIWAETDRQAALDFMLRNYQELGADSLTVTPLVSWFDEDPEVAYNWLRAIDNKAIQHKLINELRPKTLKTLETDKIFSLIDALPPSERDQYFLESFFGVVQERDFPKLLSWINLQGNDSARNYAKRIYLEKARHLDEAKMDAVIETFGMDPNAYFVSALAMKWAKQDSKAALAWIQKQQGRGIYPDLIGKYGEHLASADPSHALAWIQQVGDPMISKRYTNQVVRKLMKAQPDQSLSIIQTQLQGDALNQALFTYLRHFPSQNPQHALTALRALEDKTQLRKHYTSLLERFSADEAVALARSMPDEPELYASAIRIVASQGQPQKAIELMNSPQLAGSSKKQIAWLQATIAEKWAKTDKHAAVEWALSLPTLDGEKRALNRALYEVSFYEGDDHFAKNVIERLPSDEVKHAAINEIYKSMTNRNPTGTYEWVAEHGSATNRERVAAWATDVLLRRDSIHASEWVQSLPEGPERVIGTTKIIDSLVEASPAEAFPWALSLKDKRASASQTRKVIAYWKRVAPEEAYRAVKYSRELSESEKQSLLKSFE